MPVKNQWNGSAFTLSTETWYARNVGDEDSSPDPAFIGKKIQQMFLYRNRLGILSDDYVILSRPSSYTDFFVTSLVTDLDDDYIDLNVSDKDYAPLLHAQSFGDNLLIFSERVQFLIKSTEGNLTSKTVFATVLSNNNLNLDPDPVIIGTNLYAPSNIGPDSNILEYYLNEEGAEIRTDDITRHVRSYVPYNIKLIEGLSVRKLFLCVPEDERNRIYIYKTEFTRDNKKLQSSWCYWEMARNDGSYSDTIWAMKFVKEELYLLIRRQTGASSYKFSIEKLNFSEDKADTPSVDILIDRLATVGNSVMSYAAGQDQTTLTLPYPDYSRTTQVIRTGGGSDPFTQGIGQIQPIESWTNDSTIVFKELSGDFTDKQFLVGQPYTYKLKFPEFYFKNRETNDVINNVGFNVKWFIINYFNSALFHVDIESSYDRDTITHYKTPILTEYTLDDVPFDEGEFKVSVMSKSNLVKIVLKNTSPYNTFFFRGELIADIASKTFGRRV